MSGRGYILPFPPSVNSHLRRPGYGPVLKSKRWREYYAEARQLIMLQGACEPLSGRLAITILAYCPDKRIRDIDNLLKAPFDALEGLAYLNDSQIDELTIKRCYEGKPGRLEITITPLSLSADGGRGNG